MESNHHEEDSKTSSEEADTDHGSEQNEENHEHTTVSAGRSYECVFCKRGFSTAQALGGHMNIHRKDRAKTRPADTAADDHDHHHHHHHHNYRAIQGYPYPYPPHDHDYSSSSGSHVNYQTYNINPAASTWGLRSPPDSPAAVLDVRSRHHFCPPDSLHPDLSREHNYWRAAGIGRTSPEEDDDHNINKDKINGGCSIDNMELDLELRLGHDPY